MKSKETIFYHNNNFSTSEKVLLWASIPVLIIFTILTYINLTDIESNWKDIIYRIFGVSFLISIVVKRKFSRNNKPTFTVSDEYFIIHEDSDKGKYLKRDIEKIEASNDSVKFFMVNPEKKVSFNPQEIVKEDRELFMAEIKKLSTNFKFEKSLEMTSDIFK